MRIISLIVCSLLLSLFSIAQSPLALNYQAVARTSTGQIIPSQNIGVRFSILDGSITGTAVYQETHTVTTNNFGLFTLAIGKGTIVNGTFAGIAWGTGDKFLKVEIAPQGGTNYSLQGTTQLLSVPYALYAEKTRLLAGNNTISITNGNTISGNYQAANNTIVVNGNTLAANYVPANNTILVNGNTLAANYLAGTGISITGNTITNTGSSLWLTDANGIHNQSGNVGIGISSSAVTRLTILQQNTNGNSAAAEFQSADNWHTAVGFLNTTGGPNNRYTFSLGGPSNTEAGFLNFGLMNHNAGKWSLIVNGTTNNIGIGMNNIHAETARSRLHVFTGDVNIDEIGSGIIMKSPNGQCWRITIDNAGNLIRTAITCP